MGRHFRDRYRVANFIAAPVCNSSRHETYRDQGDCVHLRLGHSDARGILTGVEFRLHAEPRRRSRVSDAVNDGLVRCQRSSTPVRRDVAEEPVLSPTNAMRPVRGNALPPRIEPSSYWDQTFVKSKTNRSRGRCVLLADGCRRRCSRRRSPASRIHPSDLQFGVAPPSRRPGRATPGRPRPCSSAGAGSHRGRAAHSTPATSFRTRFTTPLRTAQLVQVEARPARCGPTFAGASRTGSATRCAGQAGVATSSRRSNRFGHPRTAHPSFSNSAWQRYVVELVIRAVAIPAVPQWPPTGRNEGMPDG